MFLEEKGINTQTPTENSRECPECQFDGLWGPSNCTKYRSCPECGWTEAGEVSELISEIQKLEETQAKLVDLLEKTSLSAYGGPHQWQIDAVRMLKSITGKKYGAYDY